MKLVLLTQHACTHAPVGEKRTQSTVLRWAVRLERCFTAAYPSSPRSTSHTLTSLSAPPVTSCPLG
jgi:hypothetical protein